VPRGHVVTGVLGEQVHLGAQVRLGVVKRRQPESLGADGHQIEPAVRLLDDLAHRRGAADLIERRDAVRAGLAALTDRDHAETPRLRLGHQVADQPPVPLLEDVQRQQQTWVEHTPQREQRQHPGHAARLCGQVTLAGRGERCVEWQSASGRAARKAEGVMSEMKGLKAPRRRAGDTA
jgi:hypothetical protein